jgi:hypothetical protein
MKHLFLKILMVAAVLNLCWLMYFVFTTSHAYVIATLPDLYFNSILIYIPLIIMLASLIYFFAIFFMTKRKEWLAFVPAFLALVPDTLFIMGSIFFAQPR